MPSLRSPSASLWLGLLVTSRGCVRPGRDAKKEESVEGFGEARQGDVPEGTLEMITPQTDRAIHDGLGWLSDRRTPTVRSAAARTAATSP